MSRIASLLLSLCAITLAGCSSPGPLTPQGIAGLKGKSIGVATPVQRTEFVIFTPGTVATKGVLGFLADVNLEMKRSIVNENNLPDPAEAVAQALATSLRARLGSPVPASTPVGKSDDNDAAAVSALASNNQLMLYVQTIDWRTWYYTTNFSRYRARINMSARLIDATTQTELARARCDEDSPQAPETSPTYEEMVASSAKRLKQELAIAQAACVVTLQQELLGE